MVPQVREMFVGHRCPTISLRVVAVIQFSLLAFVSCLLRLSAYPSVQMGFSVILNLSENEIQLQGKNC